MTVVRWSPENCGGDDRNLGVAGEEREGRDGLWELKDGSAGNPVRDDAIEFNMLVKMIWFLLRVQSNDGDENRIGCSVMGERGRLML
ncbi:hypothetical protein Hdeb2414_s0008g00291641 [Helianthus debilis subsp. tardiflorus]